MWPPLVFNGTQNCTLLCSVCVFAVWRACKAPLSCSVVPQNYTLSCSVCFFLPFFCCRPHTRTRVSEKKASPYVASAYSRAVQHYLLGICFFFVAGLDGKYQCRRSEFFNLFQLNTFSKRYCYRSSVQTITLSKRSWFFGCGELSAICRPSEPVIDSYIVPLSPSLRRTTTSSCDSVPTRNEICECAPGRRLQS